MSKREWECEVCEQCFSTKLGLVEHLKGEIEELIDAQTDLRFAEEQLYKLTKINKRDVLK